MNSYTVSSLSPDTHYDILLCLRRDSHKIPISVLGVVTRPESYMYQLGIVTDYTAIIAGNSNVPSPSPSPSHLSGGDFQTGSNVVPCLGLRESLLQLK